MVDISSDHYELDLTAARTHLGWMPRHSLRDDLPRIIETLKADPFAWYRDNRLNAARVAGSKVETAVAKAASGAMAGHGDSEMAREHRQSMRQMHFQMLWYTG